jgi:hypothetical protein
MAANYIPSTDSALDAWSQNFSTLISATPTDYGLTAGDATSIANAVDAFHDAYGVTLDPNTRTSPAIAAKDELRAAMLVVVRPFAMQVNAQASVTDEQRADLGLTIRKTVQTPIPPPATAPLVSLVSAFPGVATLDYRDPSTPTSKAKPFGVIGVQIFRSVGTVPAVDPAQASADATVTKSPFALSFAPGDTGKIATVFARYVTRGGPAGVAQVGPWSAPLSFNVI